MRPTTLLPIACAVLISSASKPAASTRVAQATRESAVPNWIWQGTAAENQEVVFRKQFHIPGTVPDALLVGSCDNRMTVLINGEVVATHDRWEQLVSSDVTSAIAEGENLLEVRAYNEGNVAGLALSIMLGEERVIATDASWQGASPQDAAANKWSQVTVIGKVGTRGLPWSQQVSGEDYRAERNSRTQQATTQPVQEATGLNLPDGFRAELVYQVPKEVQGSWVSITNDDKGRLYTSDQGKRGIYRVTPGAIGDPNAVTKVEKVPVKVSGAQGMCWAFNSLYVNVNGEGVWRLTDSDGDDQLDTAENLIPLGHGGEHGPHAILKTPDGTGLYFIGGNHTKAPPFDNSLAPSNWSEDLLLPRQWDARGHAAGKLAPGGWIARCDPDGKNIEIISNGYRNQYDIALNPQGEMFTFDADMEWDIGSPWYRPTRVCHVTSGSEFGWRSGTGKWPSYYEDSLPPVLNIGPGSPTGIVFGTGANFPAKYQEALFILDWTFGTIYSVHLEQAGASYTAVKEDFVWAKPLPVTDAIVGLDGALYFTVGGRGSDSALYRVLYTGSESTAPLPLAKAKTPEREQRLALEVFHGRTDASAVDSAWPSLSSPDRFLRFAARIAIENQPVDTWRERALKERETQASVLALIALARQGTPDDLAGVIEALGRMDLPQLSEQERLAALRAYSLAFIRLGEPDESLREQLIARFDALFPAASDETNSELVRLLTYLQSPTVVAKTLALMSAAPPTELPPWAELIKRNDRYGGPIAKMLDDMPPLQNIAYAFILRNATEGWTMPMRKAYFAFFVEAAKHPAGNSYAGFLENMRDEAVANLTVAETRTLASLIGQSLVVPVPEDTTQPVGPGRTWTQATALNAVSPQLRGRDYDQGRNLFHAASCSTCHRFNGEGGAIGPDLTTVANKFSVSDLIESIVDPSKVISDQYGSHIVIDKDGEYTDGLLVEDGDEVSVYPRDHGADPVVFKRSEIVEIIESSLSQMPSALLDTMNPEELKDLIAYLLSGGDKKSEVFEEEREDPVEDKE